MKPHYADHTTRHSDTQVGQGDDSGQERVGQVETSQIPFVRMAEDVLSSGDTVRAERPIIDSRYEAEVESESSSDRSEFEVEIPGVGSGRRNSLGDNGFGARLDTNVEQRSKPDADYDLSINIA